MPVVDASAYADALVNGGALGEVVRARLQAERSWDAPHILPAEVLSAIRGLVLAGSLDRAVAERARARLIGSRLHLHALAPVVDRVWDLRENLTVYDAWYVALAERLSTGLVTTDARLAAAPALRCDVEVLAV